MSKLYLRKEANFGRFKKISEARGQSLCHPGHLCQELMLNRALLAKHGRFDHGLYRLPMEIILDYLLPHCVKDWIRVMFLSSIGYGRRESIYQHQEVEDQEDALFSFTIQRQEEVQEDTILTFFHTTNLKDVCQYIGRQTSRAPHALNVGIVKEDNVVLLNPYEKAFSVPKSSILFVWVTHAFPNEGCKCPFVGTGRCKCHIQEYDWGPWIEKYGCSF